MGCGNKKSDNQAQNKDSNDRDGIDGLDDLWTDCEKSGADVENPY